MPDTLSAHPGRSMQQLLSRRQSLLSSGLGLLDTITNSAQAAVPQLVPNLPWISGESEGSPFVCAV